MKKPKGGADDDDNAASRIELVVVVIIISKYIWEGYNISSVRPAQPPQAVPISFFFFLSPPPPTHTQKATGYNLHISPILFFFRFQMDNLRAWAG